MDDCSVGTDAGNSGETESNKLFLLTEEDKVYLRDSLKKAHILITGDYILLHVSAGRGGYSITPE